MSAFFSKRGLIVPVLLGLGILASLGREIVFANFLGVSRDLEVFRLAFALPNLLSQSLAPAFIGALLPLLVTAKQQSAEDYSAFCRRLTRVSVMSVLFISLAGIFSVGLQSAMIAPGFDASSIDTLNAALRVCWLFFMFSGLSFLPRLFLNNRGEFWPGVSTSIVISSALIIVCVAGSSDGVITGRALSWAAVVAGAAILALHLIREPDQAKSLIRVFREWTTKESTTSSPILKPLALVFLIHLSNAIPRLIDRAVSTDFPQGIVAALEYSYNIITVPGILLGTTVITVFYPSFVRRVKDHRKKDLHRSLVISVSLSIAAAFLVGIGIHQFSAEIVSLIYGRGEFDGSAVQVTALLLGWHALGLGFMVATLILAQACLAYSVFWILLVIALVRILVKSIAISWLVPRFALDGLGASFIVPEFVSSIALLLLLFLLSRREAE